MPHRFELMPRRQNGNSGQGSVVFNATVDGATAIFRCPKAGTIDRFVFAVGTKGGASVDRIVNVSLESVTAGAGVSIPSGVVTPAGASVAIPITALANNTQYVATFGTPAVVTSGQLLAIVIRKGAGTWDATNTLSFGRGFSGPVAKTSGLPLMLTSTSGTWTASTGMIPVFSPLYTDDDTPDYFMAPGNGLTYLNSVNINSGSATNEYGYQITIDQPWSLDALDSWVRLTLAASACVVSVYDVTSVATGTLVASVTLDPDTDTGNKATGGYIYKPISPAVTLPAGTYIFAIRPTTANNIGLATFGTYGAKAAERMFGTPIIGARRAYSGGAGAWTKDHTVILADIIPFGTPQASGGGNPYLGSGMFPVG